MPHTRRDGRLLVVTADPGPDTVLFAREQWGAHVDFAVASKFDISWAVQSRVPRGAVGARHQRAVRIATR